MKNFRVILVVIITMLFSLSSCGARKVDKKKTSEEIIEVKKEDRKEEIQVTESDKEIQSDLELSGSFDFRLIPSNPDTVYKDRPIYIRDNHGNELKTTANPGDELIFGSNYMLTQQLNIIEKQKDSIAKINYQLEHEVENLKSKLNKKIDKKANYIYQITSILLLAVVIWIIYRYIKFRKNTLI